jgi:hypothetical protein
MTMTIRNCMRRLFIAMAAAALASCTGLSTSSLTSSGAGASMIPAAVGATTHAHARLYVAWTNNNLLGSQIRVYDASLGTHPKLLETLKTPYDEIHGMTTDAQGNLYAAACKSCDDNATSASSPADAPSANGIAVYRGARGEPSLVYAAARGEVPIRVVVGSDGTVYSGNAFYLNNSRWRLTVEVYPKGRNEPIRTIAVAKAGYRNIGLALDARGNLWASYVVAKDVNTNIKAHVYLAEYARHGSKAKRTYVLPHQYNYSEGGLAFDDAGHLVIASCLGPQPFAPCGTLILDFPSMQQVAFVEATNSCLPTGISEQCFSPAAFAFNAGESELWATTLNGVYGYTYPAGSTVALVPSNLSNHGHLPYGVVIGP